MWCTDSSYQSRRFFFYKVEAIQISYVVGIKNHKNPSHKSMTCCEIYWLFFPKSKHYQKYGIRLVGCLPTDQSRSLFLVMFTFRKVVISWGGGTFRFIENQVENWWYHWSLWFYGELNFTNKINETKGTTFHMYRLCHFWVLAWLWRNLLI